MHHKRRDKGVTSKKRRRRREGKGINRDGNRLSNFAGEEIAVYICWVWQIANNSCFARIIYFTLMATNIRNKHKWIMSTRAAFRYFTGSCHGQIRLARRRERSREISREVLASHKLYVASRLSHVVTSSVPRFLFFSHDSDLSYVYISVINAFHFRHFCIASKYSRVMTQSCVWSFDIFKYLISVKD